MDNSQRRHPLLYPHRNISEFQNRRVSSCSSASASSSSYASSSSEDNVFGHRPMDNNNTPKNVDRRYNGSGNTLSSHDNKAYRHEETLGRLPLPHHSDTDTSHSKCGFGYYMGDTHQTRSSPDMCSGQCRTREYLAGGIVDHADMVYGCKNLSRGSSCGHINPGMCDSFTSPRHGTARVKNDMDGTTKENISINSGFTHSPSMQVICLSWGCLVPQWQERERERLGGGGGGPAFYIILAGSWLVQLGALLL